MPSRGDLSCKLAIFLDYPNTVDDRRGKGFLSQAGLFVDFCLQRMSISPSLVYLDYNVKCYPGKLPGVKSERMGIVAACSQYRVAALQDMPNLAAVVMLGSLGCEITTGSKTVGGRAGAEWEPAGVYMKQLVRHVWIGYSPSMLSEKPSEAGSIFRVIWKAAEEAGLKPKVNLTIKPFEFDV